MKEQVIRTHKGGIVYEPSRFGKSNPPDDSLFEPAHWESLGASTRIEGGRAAVLFVRHAEQRWVLRHYRRGGLIARVSSDRYLWRGADATRSFREWRLLTRLHAAGLPVPAPVAARYVRHGLTYSADLLTEELPEARSLAQTLAARALAREEWQNVGATIARFHDFGAQHVDLNAHNILLSDRKVYILDFDRGGVRKPNSLHDAWQDAVLARLLRSLHKIKTQQPQLHFNDSDWMELLSGYEAQRR